MELRCKGWHLARTLRSIGLNQPGMGIVAARAEYNSRLPLRLLLSMPRARGATAAPRLDAQHAPIRIRGQCALTKQGWGLGQ